VSQPLTPIKTLTDRIVSAITDAGVTEAEAHCALGVVRNYIPMMGLPSVSSDCQYDAAVQPEPSL